MKGEEFLNAGIVYAPWTIQFKEPEFVAPDGLGFFSNSIVVKFGGKKSYDIVKVKEWLRRKKIKSTFGEKTINEKFYGVVRGAYVDVPGPEGEEGIPTIELKMETKELQGRILHSFNVSPSPKI